MNDIQAYGEALAKAQAYAFRKLLQLRDQCQDQMELRRIVALIAKAKRRHGFTEPLTIQQPLHTQQPVPTHVPERVPVQACIRAHTSQPPISSPPFSRTLPIHLPALPSSEDFSAQPLHAQPIALTPLDEPAPPGGPSAGRVLPIPLTSPRA